MKPKDLLSATREKHPEARKKEVVLAAFHLLIESKDAGSDQMRNIHTFALGERGSNEDEAAPSAKPRKKRKHRKDTGAQPAAQ